MVLDLEGVTMASLIGSDRRRRILSKQVVTIGRDPDNDIVLSADTRASRTHAELRLLDGRWIVADLGSRNGTTINGHRISRRPLRDGDQITMGSTTLSFVSEGDPLATEAATLSIPPELTERERQILELVADGRTDKDIGETLYISVNTVRSHLDRIRGKTGLRRRSELTRYSIELEISSGQE